MFFTRDKYKSASAFGSKTSLNTFVSDHFTSLNRLQLMHLLHLRVQGLHHHLHPDHRLHQSRFRAHLQRLLVLGSGEIFPAVRRIQNS